MPSWRDLREEAERSLASGGVENAADRLLAVAQELRQFETIFVEEPHDDVGVEARIFTVEEELPFAGHPVIGAAAALHERLASDEGERQWHSKSPADPWP